MVWPAGRDGILVPQLDEESGLPHDLFDCRPVIGICNTWSELTPCNGHFRELAEFVKRGVWEAGGFPLEFPAMSLGETQLRPTAMLFRNLASMDVEESIRGNPINGVVLLMGCDKTTPSLLMGAASCDLPTIGLSGGPMLSGKFRGRDLGSGSGVWQMFEQHSCHEHPPVIAHASPCTTELHRVLAIPRCLSPASTSSFKGGSA
jgi:L-arabonate dehydrase